jgi:hypothetical protein
MNAARTTTPTGRAGSATLDELVTLAEAAESLGLAAVTLRAAAARGRVAGRKVGKTWVTTRAEVDRYRRERLRRGRRARGGAPANDAPKTDMGARGEDGQVYGG